MPDGYLSTHAGAEVDLVLEAADGSCTAIEIKRTLSPKLTPAFRESMTTLNATQGYYITPEGDPLAIGDHFQIRDALKVGDVGRHQGTLMSESRCRDPDVVAPN